MKRDFITILALMTALSSCNDDALFEKEMYKNVVVNSRPGRLLSRIFCCARSKTASVTRQTTLT